MKEVMYKQTLGDLRELLIDGELVLNLPPGSRYAQLLAATDKFREGINVTQDDDDLWTVTEGAEALLHLIYFTSSAHILCEYGVNETSPRTIDNLETTVTVTIGKKK